MIISYAKLRNDIQYQNAYIFENQKAWIDEIIFNCDDKVNKINLNGCINRGDVNINLDTKFTNILGASKATTMTIISINVDKKICEFLIFSIYSNKLTNGLTNIKGELSIEWTYPITISGKQAPFDITINNVTNSVVSDNILFNDYISEIPIKRAHMPRYNKNGKIFDKNYNYMIEKPYTFNDTKLNNIREIKTPMNGSQPPNIGGENWVKIETFPYRLKWALFYYITDSGLDNDGNDPIAYRDSSFNPFGILAVPLAEGEENVKVWFWAATSDTLSVPLYTGSLDHTAASSMKAVKSLLTANGDIKLGQFIVEKTTITENYPYSDNFTSYYDSVSDEYHIIAPNCKITKPLEYKNGNEIISLRGIIGFTPKNIKMDTFTMGELNGTHTKPTPIIGESWKSYNYIFNDPKLQTIYSPKIFSCGEENVNFSVLDFNENEPIDTYYFHGAYGNDVFHYQLTQYNGANFNGYDGNIKSVKVLSNQIWPIAESKYTEWIANNSAQWSTKKRQNTTNTALSAATGIGGAIAAAITGGVAAPLAIGATMLAANTLIKGIQSADNFKAYEKDLNNNVGVYGNIDLSLSSGKLSYLKPKIYFYELNDHQKTLTSYDLHLNGYELSTTYSLSQILTNHRKYFTHLRIETILPWLNEKIPSWINEQIANNFTKGVTYFFFKDNKSGRLDLANWEIELYE